MNKEIYQNSKDFLPKGTPEREILELIAEIKEPVYEEINNLEEWQLELEYQQAMSSEWAFI